MSSATKFIATLRRMRISIKTNGLFLFAAHQLDDKSTWLRSLIISQKLNTSGLMIGPRSFVRGLCYLRIGDNFHAGEGLWLEAVYSYGPQTFSPKIQIGRDVSISHWTHIAATNLVVIGDGTLIGSKVLITDHGHGIYEGRQTSPEMPPTSRPLDSDKSVTIGSNVWLGDNVVVLPGSSVGDGCIIGANSVVRGNIPAFSIAAGSPIRLIKRYDFDKKEWVKI